MKKLLFVIIFLVSGIWSYGQGRVWKETSKPVRPKTNFTIKKDFILVNDSTFMWLPNVETPQVDSTWVYVPVAPAGRNGTDGKNAFIDIGTVSTLTGAPGTQAQVIVTDSDPSIHNVTADFNFIIPAGQKGDKGDPGTPGSGSINVYPSMIAMLESSQTSGFAITVSFHSGEYKGGWTWFADQSGTVDFIETYPGNGCKWHKLNALPELDAAQYGGVGKSQTLSNYTSTQLSKLYPSQIGVTTGDQRDWAAMATIAWAGNIGYVSISTRPMNYRVNKSIEDPKSSPLASFRFEREGNGSMISPTVNGLEMWRRKCDNQTEAMNMVQYADNFRGWAFVGNGSSGEIGLRVDASFNSVIEQNHFNNCYEGLQVNFGLMSAAYDNMYTNCKNTGKRIDYGRRWGGTWANAASNHHMSIHERHFCTAGQAAADRHYGCSGGVTIGKIYEGANPQIDLDFNADGSTVTKDFTQLYTHVEHAPSIAAFKMNLNGGYARIKGVYTQYDNTLIDVSGAGYPHFYIEDVPWFTPGTKFKTTGTNIVWEFSEIPTNNIDQSSYWIGGLVPYYWNSKIYQQNLKWRGRDLQWNAAGGGARIADMDSNLPESTYEVWIYENTPQGKKYIDKVECNDLNDAETKMSWMRSEKRMNEHYIIHERK